MCTIVYNNCTTLGQLLKENNTPTHVLLEVYNLGRQKLHLDVLVEVAAGLLNVRALREVGTIAPQMIPIL